MNRVKLIKPAKAATYTNGIRKTKFYFTIHPRSDGTYHFMRRCRNLNQLCGLNSINNLFGRIRVSVRQLHLESNKLSAKNPKYLVSDTGCMTVEMVVHLIKRFCNARVEKRYVVLYSNEIYLIIIPTADTVHQDMSMTLNLFRLSSALEILFCMRGTKRT